MGLIAGCEMLPGSASLGKASKIGKCFQFPSRGPPAQAVRPCGAPVPGSEAIPAGLVLSQRRWMLTGQFQSPPRIQLQSGLCAGRPGQEEQCDIWS